jgi:uncharacterized membrane protein YdjX (TVP38/TMEM64 family)
MTGSGKTTPYAMTIAGIAALVIVAVVWFAPGLWMAIRPQLASLSDGEQVRSLVSGAGPAGPLVFIGVQVAQVLLAPIPGEISGFIGGYLFGTGWGFVYSTIGLTLGSALNFSIGRYLGRRWVRRLIPSRHLDRFDMMVKQQAVGGIFVLFVFPGFPKDYLSLFLGLSTLPMPVFIAIAAVGRMPGTLLLSLQGAALLEKMYTTVAVVAAASVLLVALAYGYRQPVYRWLAKRSAGQPSGPANKTGLKNLDSGSKGDPPWLSGA